MRAGSPASPAAAIFSAYSVSSAALMFLLLVLKVMLTSPRDLTAAAAYAFSIAFSSSEETSPYTP